MSKVVLYDAIKKCWLQYEEPVEVVQAFRTEEVLDALHRIESLVNDHHYGAAGFISYEAAPAFDSALTTRPNDGSLPLLWFGLFEQEDGLSQPAAQSRLREPGKGKPLPIVHTSRQPFPAEESDPQSPLCWKPSVGKEEYRTAIDRIKSCIHSGDTYQVNYSFRLRSPFSGDAYELFLQLSEAQPSSHGACIVTDDFALCSVSPELFFLLDGEHITTRPMKGTAPRGLTSAHDKQRAESLRNSEKDRAENLMIVDMMRNDLGRIAGVGSVRVASLFDVERYPTVWQMTSTVEATTQASVAEIMKALFPCASVTGAPKARTMEIIAELESTPRNVYTGAIGFITPNRKAQFNVAIRTVLVDRKKQEATYGVGGGVVWASTAEGEYDECLAKARILTEVRPKFVLFETILFTRSEGYFLLDDHLGRLKDSCEYFDIEYSEAAIRLMLDKVRPTFCENAYRVRLLLRANGLPMLDAETVAVETPGKPVRLKLATVPVDSANLFLYHKTTNRKIYDEARASAADCDDVLLWNERGEVTESTIANIVVEVDGEMFTPPVACGLLAGTFRGRLLKEGRIKERVITLEEFTQSSRIFLINSLRQWREAVLET